MGGLCSKGASTTPTAPKTDGAAAQINSVQSVDSSVPTAVAAAEPLVAATTPAAVDAPTIVIHAAADESPATPVDGALAAEQIALEIKEINASVDARSMPAPMTPPAADSTEEIAALTHVPQEAAALVALERPEELVPSPAALTAVQAPEELVSGDEERTAIEASVPATASKSSLTPRASVSSTGGEKPATGAAKSKGKKGGRKNGQKK